MLFLLVYIVCFFSFTTTSIFSQNCGNPVVFLSLLSRSVRNPVEIQLAVADVASVEEEGVEEESLAKLSFQAPVNLPIVSSGESLEELQVRLKNAEKKFVQLERSHTKLQRVYKKVKTIRDQLLESGSKVQEDYGKEVHLLALKLSKAGVENDTLKKELISEQDFLSKTKSEFSKLQSEHEAAVSSYDNLFVAEGKKASEYNKLLRQSYEREQENYLLKEKLVVKEKDNASLKVKAVDLEHYLQKVSENLLSLEAEKDGTRLQVELLENLVNKEKKNHFFANKSVQKKIAACYRKMDCLKSKIREKDFVLRTLVARTQGVFQQNNELVRKNEELVGRVNQLSERYRLAVLEIEKTISHQMRNRHYADYCDKVKLKNSLINAVKIGDLQNERIGLLDQQLSFSNQRLFDLGEVSVQEDQQSVQLKERLQKEVAKNIVLEEEKEQLEISFNALREDYSHDMSDFFHGQLKERISLEKRLESAEEPFMLEMKKGAERYDLLFEINLGLEAEKIQLSNALEVAKTKEVVLTGRVDELQIFISKLQKDYALATEELNKNFKTKEKALEEEYRQKCSQLKESCENILTYSNDKKVRSSQLIKKVKKLRGRKRELKKRLQVLEAENVGLVTDRDQEVAAVAKEKEFLIDSLRSDLEKVTNDLSFFKGQNSQLLQDKVGLEEKSFSQELRLKTLEQKYDAILGEVQQQVEHAQRSMSFDDVLAERDELKNSLSQVEEQFLAKLYQQKDSFGKSLSASLTRIAKKKERIVNLKRMLREHKSLNVELSTRVGQLEKSLEASSFGALPEKLKHEVQVLLAQKESYAQETSGYIARLEVERQQLAGLAKSWQEKAELLQEEAQHQEKGLVLHQHGVLSRLQKEKQVMHNRFMLEKNKLQNRLNQMVSSNLDSAYKIQEKEQDLSMSKGQVLSLAEMIEARIQEAVMLQDRLQQVESSNLDFAHQIQKKEEWLEQAQGQVLSLEDMIETKKDEIGFLEGSVDDLYREQEQAFLEKQDLALKNKILQDQLLRQEEKVLGASKKQLDESRSYLDLSQRLLAKDHEATALYKLGRFRDQRHEEQLAVVSQQKAELAEERQALREQNADLMGKWKHAIEVNQVGAGGLGLAMQRVREEKAGHGKLRAVADRYLELVGIKDPLSGQLDSSSFVKKGVQEEISRIPLADLMRGTVVISSQLRSLLEEDDFLKEIIAEVVSHGDSLTKLLGNKKYVKNATALQKFDMGQAKQEEVRNCLNCYKVFLIRKNNSQNDTPVKRVANNQLWKDYARSVAQQMEAPEVEFVDLRQASTEDNPMLRVFVRG